MIPCIFFGVCGLLLGSFLNVCILRLPLGESIVRPRSHCRNCQKPIASFDNIPVLSWLLLRGACRACGESISWRYPAIELAACALFLLCCFYFSFSWPAAAWALFCFLVLGLAVMDAETLLLPDAFTLPGLALGILLAGLGAGFAQGYWKWRPALQAAGRSALAAVAAAATLLLIAGIYWLARRRMGMGFGDVKLLAMVAAWLGLPQTVLTLLIAVVAGAFYGVFLLVAAPGNAPPGEDKPVPPAQIPIPFGTMISLAALYCVFLGQRTVSWYLHLFS